MKFAVVVIDKLYSSGYEEQMLDFVKIFGNKENTTSKLYGLSI